ncbi:alpha/beta-hydrolase, partial [Hymenopellis radicata]
DFASPGVSSPTGTQVHEGFLKSWNSVAETVISAVRSELDANPGYDLVTTGHSLGASLASIGGISLQENFPNLPVRMYTYGQPRTGNANYAAFVNAQMGSRVFRNVHTTDGVPTIIPTSLGYAHHGVEYWQSPDPASPSTVTVCDPAGEDPTCSASIPSGGINAAHRIYFGIPLGTSFCA